MKTKAKKKKKAQNMEHEISNIFARIPAGSENEQRSLTSTVKEDKHIYPAFSHLWRKDLFMGGEVGFF